jgi:hypothetical protein
LVAVDAFFLRALLDPFARSDAVAHFFRSHTTKVLVPTPALAKVLTDVPEKAQVWMDVLNNSNCFQIRPFDDKASVELTEILGPGAAGIRDVLRFDRQSVAIAKVYGAGAIFTEDDSIAEFAGGCGIPVKRQKDLH